MRLLDAASCLVFAATLTACSGSLSYQPPQASVENRTFVDVDIPKHLLLEKIVRALNRRALIVDTPSESSGVINAAYTGDPEKYVDCGNIVSAVRDLTGERTYVIPAAREHATFVMMTDGRMVRVDRHIDLSAKLFITIALLSDTESRMTVDTKYTLHKSVSLGASEAQSSPIEETIYFRTGGSATFMTAGVRAICRTTGELETEILAAAGSLDMQR